MDTEPAHSISKRLRVGEGRPTLYTPELADRLADHIAAGLTDEEAAALEDISCDCIRPSRCGAGRSGSPTGPFMLTLFPTLVLRLFLQDGCRLPLARTLTD